MYLWARSLFFVFIDCVNKINSSSKHKLRFWNIRKLRWFHFCHNFFIHSCIRILCVESLWISVFYLVCSIIVPLKFGWTLCWLPCRRQFCDKMLPIPRKSSFLFAIVWIFSWSSIILQFKVNGAQKTIPSNIIIILTDDQDVVLNGMVRPPVLFGLFRNNQWRDVEKKSDLSDL